MVLKESFDPLWVGAAYEERDGEENEEEEEERGRLGTWRSEIDRRGR